jgi:hypothetical protein
MTNLIITIVTASVYLSQAVSTPAPTNRLNKATRVSLFGIGNVRAGMSVRAAERAANDKLVQTQDVYGGCTFVKPQHGPDGISFMVIDGKIARVDVENKFTATAQGARVGDSETRIKRLYAGRVRVSSHAYIEGHYLTVVGPDGRHGFVFETDGRKVTQYRAGTRVAIRYVEGCS